MAKWMGIVCILLGVLCLLGAVGFLVYNDWEADSAEKSSQTMLEAVRLALEQGRADRAENATQGDDLVEVEQAPAEMATVQVDGYDCIGVLSIPVLELELPVLTEWSYTKLKKAPCLYYGTCYTPDFVIAAHNYRAHFGRLSQLQPGDLVIFTDATGEVHRYQVVLLETLPKEATLEMIASGFDLSLYTCTPGGGNRVTVRCTK